MAGTILAIILLAGVPLALMALRTNAAIVLLSLLAGTVLAQNLYPDMVSVIKGFLAPTIMTGFIAYMVISILPPLLLAFWCRNSSNHKFAFHILPSIFCGLVLYFITFDAAPSSVRHMLESSAPHPYIATYKLFVIVGGVLVSMLALMMLNHSSSKKH